MSLFEVIINNVVLVTTFIITYFSIDKKNIEKDEKIKENKEYVLKQYLKDTYNKCLEIIIQLDNTNEIKKYIIPKTDFNKLPQDDKLLNYIATIPFVDNDKVICNLFNDGILTQTYLKNYINIKHNYSTYVISRIAFFDKISLTDSKSVEIKNMINCELKKLEQ